MTRDRVGAHAAVRLDVQIPDLRELRRRPASARAWAGCGRNSPRGPRPAPGGCLPPSRAGRLYGAGPVSAPSARSRYSSHDVTPCAHSDCSVAGPTPGAWIKVAVSITPLVWRRGGRFVKKEVGGGALAAGGRQAIRCGTMRPKKESYMSNNEAAIAEFVAAAEAALAHAWNGPVRLGDAEVLRERGRNRVLRCPVVEAPDGCPTSVILKASVGEGEEAFDPDRTAWAARPGASTTNGPGRSWSGAWAQSPPWRAPVRGGPGAGLVITEDLGAGECLADRMQGTDRQGLGGRPVWLTPARWAACMQSTAGREAEWHAAPGLVRRPAEQEREREGVRWLRENVAPSRRSARRWASPSPPGSTPSVAQVQAAMDAPGPFLAFTPGDTCPDNHRFVTDRRPLLLRLRVRRLPPCPAGRGLPARAVPHLLVCQPPAARTCRRAWRRLTGRNCSRLPRSGRRRAFLSRLWSQANAYWAIASVSWRPGRSAEEDRPLGPLDASAAAPPAPGELRRGQ